MLARKALLPLMAKLMSAVAWCRLILHIDLGSVGALAADERAADGSGLGVEGHAFGQRCVVAAVIDGEGVGRGSAGGGDGASGVGGVLCAAGAGCGYDLQCSAGRGYCHYRRCGYRSCRVGGGQRVGCGG